MREVRRYLRDKVDRDALYALCRGLLTVDPSSRVEAEDLLLNALGASRPGEGLSGLLPNECELLRILFLADGDLPRHVLINLLGERVPGCDAEGLVQDLGARGLLFFEPEGTRLFFPWPLLPLLEGLRPRHPHPKFPASTNDPLGRSLALVATYLRAHPLRLTRKGEPHKTWFVRLENFFRNTELKSLVLTRLIGFLRAQGTLREEGGFLLTREPLLEQLVQRGESWLRRAFLGFCRQQNHLEPQVVLHALARFGGEAERYALEVKSLASLLRAEAWPEPADDQQLRQDLSNLRRELGLLQALGFVAVAGSPEVFQLAPESEKPQGQFFIQQDGQVLCPDPLAAKVLLTLGKLADFLEADSVNRFHLSRGAVIGALESGMAREVLESFLEEFGHGELPQAVRVQLEVWAEDHGDAEFHHGVVVVLKDPALAQLCLDLKETRRWIRRVLAPTVLLLDPDGIDQFMASLEQSGFSPRRSIHSEREDAGDEQLERESPLLEDIPRPRVLRRSGQAWIPEAQALAKINLIAPRDGDSQEKVWFEKTVGKWRDGLSLRKKALLLSLCARYAHAAHIERQEGDGQDTVWPQRVHDGIEPWVDVLSADENESDEMQIYLREIRRVKVQPLDRGTVKIDS